MDIVSAAADISLNQAARCVPAPARQPEWPALRERVARTLRTFAFVADARVWLEESHLDLPALSKLDRVFAVRYGDGGVDLPMVAATAAALSGAATEGRWILVRADHPDDAFVHAMHRSDGRGCVRPDEKNLGSDTIRCATEEIYDGDHHGLRLTWKRLEATAGREQHDPELPPHVRVPYRS